MKLRFFALLSFFLAVTTLCSCSNNKRIDETFFAMDTVVTFTVYENREDFSSLCLSLLSSAEKELTACGGYRITAVEDGQTFSLTDTLSSIIERSFTVSELTDGDYDLTVAPLVSLWNVKEATSPPSDVDIEKARSLVGFKSLCLTNNTLTFPLADMGIDLGSVGKGWAGDMIADGLVENGIESGIINLGGNIRVFGHNPMNDDGIFSVGIKDPFDTSSIVGYVKVKNTNVITSGTYERFFEFDGNIYHHILDPKTGYPAQSGLASVTVICSDGILADMLSTALFVIGEERGIELLEKISETYPDIAAVFVSTDGAVNSFNVQLYGTN